MSFTLSTVEGYLPFTRINLPLKTAPWSKSDQMENWASLFEILMAFQRKNDTQDTTIAGIVASGAMGLAAYGLVHGDYTVTTGAGNTVIPITSTGSLLNVTYASNALTVTNAGVYLVVGMASMRMASNGQTQDYPCWLDINNGITATRVHGYVTDINVPTHVNVGTGVPDTFQEVLPLATLFGWEIQSLAGGVVIDLEFGQLIHNVTSIAGHAALAVLQLG